MKAFRLFFQSEETAELGRKRLAKRPFFNVHEAFAAVDSDRDGFITRDEFKQILKEYKFYPTDQEVTQLIERFSRNRDGRVSYSEFVEEIMPRGKQIGK